MRVIDCDCGVTLQAANDEELAKCVREHVESDHSDMQLDDDQARDMVEQKAYSAMDS
jgi:predicted small metal-binding protein